MNTIAERVAAGAAFLDERDPDWWRTGVNRAIDLDELALSSSRWCVLGQRCPLEALSEYTGIPTGDLDGSDQRWRYWAYLVRLTDVDGRAEWAHSHGFTGAEGSRLTAEWKRVITERRAGA